MEPGTSLQVFFLAPKNAFRPYLGIGLQRTWFTDGKITNSAFETAALGGPTATETDSVWGPIFNIGFTYAFSDHWFAGFSVSYIPVSTTSRFTTQLRTPVGILTRRSEAKVTLNPIVTCLRVGYKF